MKLSTTITTTLLSLTSTLALALAAPSAPPAPPAPETIRAAQPGEITYQPDADADADTPLLHKRADHGVRLCTDADWGGYCVTITAPANVCVPLGLDLEDKVSAVGPDQGAYCRFFSARDCKDTEGHFDLTYPGYSNLASVGPFNDRVSSYWCEDF